MGHMGQDQLFTVYYEIIAAEDRSVHDVTTLPAKNVREKEKKSTDQKRNIHPLEARHELW